MKIKYAYRKQYNGHGHVRSNNNGHANRTNIWEAIQQEQEKCGSGMTAGGEYPHIGIVLIIKNNAKDAKIKMFMLGHRLVTKYVQSSNKPKDEADPAWK